MWRVNKTKFNPAQSDGWVRDGRAEGSRRRPAGDKSWREGGVGASAQGPIKTAQTRLSQRHQMSAGTMAVLWLCVSDCDAEKCKNKVSPSLIHLTASFSWGSRLNLSFIQQSNQATDGTSWLRLALKIWLIVGFHKCENQISTKPRKQSFCVVVLCSTWY